MPPTIPTIDLGQTGLSLLGFLPELVICTAIVLLLLLRLFKAFDRTHLGGIALVMTLLALLFSVVQFPDVGRWAESLFGPRSTVSDIIEGARGNQPAYLFDNLLAYDSLTVFLRCFLYGFTALVIWLTLITGIPDREDSADFYVLLLGATLGMSIMASATHLIDPARSDAVPALCLRGGARAR